MTNEQQWDLTFSEWEIGPLELHAQLRMMWAATYQMWTQRDKPALFATPTPYQNAKIPGKKRRA